MDRIFIIYTIVICPVLRISLYCQSFFLYSSIHPFSGTFPASSVLSFSTVGLWNANGHRYKAKEFKDFIYDRNSDITLLSETHFSQGSCSGVANHELFHISSGTAVYVKSGLNASLAKIPRFDCIEATPIILDFSLHTQSSGYLRL